MPTSELNTQHNFSDKKLEWSPAALEIFGSLTVDELIALVSSRRSGTKARTTTPTIERFCEVNDSSCGTSPIVTAFFESV
jgi:hypothetical protein